MIRKQTNVNRTFLILLNTKTDESIKKTMDTKERLDQQALETISYGHIPDCLKQIR